MARKFEVKGKIAAKKAINQDDARGYRKRVAKAKRITGETATSEKEVMRHSPKKMPVNPPKGEPPNQKTSAGKRGTVSAYGRLYKPKGEPPNQTTGKKAKRNRPLPPNQTKSAGKRQFARNPGDLGKLIKGQQRKKPY